MRSNKTMSRDLQFSLMGSVVELMIKAGLSEDSIRASLEQGLVRSRNRQGGGGSSYQDTSYLPNGDVSADVLRIWHRDDRYLNEDDAKPRPLSLFRGPRSVRALISSLDPNVDSAQVVEFMKSSGLIHKTANGRYIPAREAEAISREDPFVAEHLARSVVRLLGTVRRNTCNDTSARSLIERYAYVSDLDQSEVGAFAEFTKSQGTSYLQAVDDWMEQRRARQKRGVQSTKRRGVVAGVQVVAYLGDALEAGGGKASARRSKGTEKDGPE